MANPKDVFVVHGHDRGMKDTIARFLSKVGLNPIILHEQPDEGQTIIEKFEKHADVSFAVAIFSRDDLGVAVNDIEMTEPVEKVLRPRAGSRSASRCSDFGPKPLDIPRSSMAQL
jgi:predicted nucleotide-binding protein